MEKTFKNIVDAVKKNDAISDDMFKYYNAKRGLRNPDGSGVLVGLTEVSSVQGYIIDDGDVVPSLGKLFYRGKNLVDLTEGFTSENRMGFEEISYLLLTGNLPTKNELDLYRKTLVEEREIHKNFVRDQLSTYRVVDIMNALARAILTLYATDPNPDETDCSNVVRQGISIMSKFHIIVAYAYRVYLSEFKNKSLIIHNSIDELSIAENFLHLIKDDGKFTQTEAQLLDLALVLHADHGGGNNSTFSTRVVTSSGTDTYSAIAAGVGSLKGPLHGGANLYVMKMMDEIKNGVKDWSDDNQIKEMIIKILDKKVENKSGKIYGFGHAVYTMSDPRAVILKAHAGRLAKEKGKDAEFSLYQKLEELVPKVFNEYKGNDKIISPNVDFYSGFVYDCMGIPREVYTPLFAVARVTGWISHRIEEIQVQKKIMRPAYKNVTSKSAYVKLSNR